VPLLSLHNHACTTRRPTSVITGNGRIARMRTKAQQARNQSPGLQGLLSCNRLVLHAARV
jgi:hypothetical protein